MIESDEEQGRDLSRLVVSRAGRLVATGDAHEPYRIVGPGGEVVEPVPVFLRDLLASGKSESTLRSYSVGLLRWWRFLDAVCVEWDRASRAEARDFSCRIQLTAKQRLQTSRPRAARLSSRAAGAPNPVTGKPASGDGYAPSTVAHSETVLRRFYDFHRDCGTGPVLNPFPLDASRRRRGRPNAHHNPMDEWRPERSGRYRPAVPRRIPRAIPDGWFGKLFTSLPSDRDRALVAFWISTGARAAELLGMRQCDFRPGEQLISVVRKGTRAVQELPASADAFVWHRLYQQELLKMGVPQGRRQPAWWTLRRPYRPLSYHGAHRMFERVNASLGADWTLHDLRHSAASRMSRDKELSLILAGCLGPALAGSSGPIVDRLAGCSGPTLGRAGCRVATCSGPARGRARTCGACSLTSFGPTVVWLGACRSWRPGRSMAAEPGWPARPPTGPGRRPGSAVRVQSWPGSSSGSPSLPPSRNVKRWRSCCRCVVP